jgi:hypothetical protein
MVGILADSDCMGKRAGLVDALGAVRTAFGMINDDGSSFFFLGMAEGAV